MMTFFNSPVTAQDSVEAGSLTMDYSSRVIPSTLYDNVGVSDMAPSIFLEPPTNVIRPTTKTKLASATIISESVGDSKNIWNNNLGSLNSK